MSTPRVEAKSQPSPAARASKPKAAAPVQKAEVATKAQPTNGTSSPSATADTVTLGQGGVDVDLANQKKLSKFAEAQGRNGAAEATIKLTPEAPSAAPTPDIPDRAHGSGHGVDALEHGWSKTDNGMKAVSGILNFSQGMEDVRQGNTKKGVCEMATGVIEEAQVCGSQVAKLGSKVGSWVSSKVPVAESVKLAVGAKLASIGSTATSLIDGGGSLMSFAGAGINGYECYDALKKGHTLTAVEKGVDTAASSVSAIATLPPVATAAETALTTYGAMEAGAVIGAGGGAAALGLCTVAAATGYSLGRAIGGVTGLDKVVQDTSERLFFDEGSQALRRTETNNAAATAISAKFDDEQLKYQLKGDPASFVRAVQGNLDRIEVARANGDIAAGDRARTELARLRAVQRGEV